MSTTQDLSALAVEATLWRRDIHSHPEVGYDLSRTAHLVAERLRAFGVDEVIEGIGRIGVVGVIRGKNAGTGRIIGLRADMDALPMQEQTNLPHASRTDGKMHACGHDGHTAMLLGAAKHLAARRDFAGTAVVIFQPAEEGGNGALEMVEDGFLDTLNISEVYGMHNMPGLAPGTFAIRPGPIMGAVDMLTIRIEGRGCHAAMPHTGTDAILAGAHLVQALQTIVARQVDPLDSAVVTVTTFRAGSAFNIIPSQVYLNGTVRSLKPETRAEIERRLRLITQDTARMFGIEASVDYEHLCPPTINHAAETGFALAAAQAVSGATTVEGNAPPIMAGEDFAFMLNARPGAFIFIGNGDSAGLHHPSYDFNDAIIPDGIRYWTELVRQRCGSL